MGSSFCSRVKPRKPKKIQKQGIQNFEYGNWSSEEDEDMQNLFNSTQERSWRLKSSTGMEKKVGKEGDVRE
jgi:hypothetical protein